MEQAMEIMWKSNLQSYSSSVRCVEIDSKIQRKKITWKSKKSNIVTNILNNGIMYTSSTPENILEFINAALFAQIINETINEFDLMIKFFAKFVDNIKDEIFGYRTLDDRFGQITAEHFREFRISTQYSDHHHLMKQVRTLTRLLSQLYREVKARNTFSTIFHYLIDSNKMKKDEENILTEFEANTKHFNSLILLFRNEKLESMKMNYEYNRFVQKMKQKYENKFWHKVYEVNYLQKWEDSRCEQLEIKLSESEDVFKFVIQTQKIEVEKENICNFDVSKFVGKMDNEYRNDIQKWMETYEIDMETYENNIFKLKVNLEKLANDKQIMQETFKRRQKEIDEWLEYKRMKKKKEEKIRLESWAATKIQAWWRGTMQRRKLGPYRKKRKSQKGKKYGQPKSKRGLKIVRK